MMPGPLGGCHRRRIYELSGTRNLIHIVLDTFPSPTFAGILDADRPALRP